MENQQKAVVLDGKYFPEEMRKNCRILLNFLDRGGALESFLIMNLAINYPNLRKCAFFCTSPCKLGQEMQCLGNLQAEG
ncbi:MAG: hypothetical protein WC831_03310 [Parcubacteria group bacterium]